jgi:glycine/D-amino acid oxidase-like deaminating enzyme
MEGRMSGRHSGGRRIVVVGAGILGCSAAYHLLERGGCEVTVLDASAIGAGTTSAGAGFVSHWSAGMIPMGREGLALQVYGIGFFKALQARGIDIGCKPNGTLLMALTGEGFERFVRPVLDSPYAPADLRRLDPAQIAEATAGLVDVGRVFGGVLNPGGIQIETEPTIMALAAEVRRLGGRILENTPVRRLVEDEAAIRVETDGEVLEADRLIVAAGRWTNEVLAPVGCRLPLLRLLATRIVTGDLGLPPTIPTIQCREIPIWIREKAGGLTWGTTDGYRPMHALEAEGYSAPVGQPRRSDMVEALLARQHGDLEQIFPPLRGAGVESWSQGCPCYTPDNNLIVGPIAGHPRIIVAAGDNESGVTHGPGIGRLVSELALDAPAFVDPSPFRPDRFPAGKYPGEAAVEAALQQARVAAVAALEGGGAV